jgi:hypothetical protein
VRLLSLLVGLIAGCGFSVSGGAAPGDGNNDPPDDVGPDTPADMDTEPPPLCPDGDDDLDTVCNSADVCGNNDDRVDSDADLVPDGCDTWPCGVAPPAPSDTVVWQQTEGGDSEGITLSDTRIGGMESNLFVVAPGAQFSVRADYAIFDCVCTGCVDQIQVGLVPGMTKQCIYDGNPSGNSVSGCDTPTTGQDSMVMLTAPMLEGVYDLRFRLGNADFCAQSAGWWVNQEPPAAQTFGTICVYAP